MSGAYGIKAMIVFRGLVSARGQGLNDQPGDADEPTIVTLGGVTPAVPPFG